MKATAMQMRGSSTRYNGRHYRYTGRRTRQQYKRRAVSLVVDAALMVIVLVSMIVGITGVVKSFTIKDPILYNQIARDQKEINPPVNEFPKMEGALKGVEIVSTATVEAEPIPIVEEPEVVQTPYEIMTSNLGEATIDTGIGTLVQYDLPSVYYPGLDFSSFQPYMSYKCITNKASAAYQVISDDRMYIDDLGMCRFSVDPNTQFTINGEDDYVIALGTFYKPKGTCGDRWLIVTSTGAYTATTGDEKADAHTDPMNMYSSHADGSCAGIIEWIVDTSTLETTMKRMGTITKGPIEAIQGEIVYIYRIE